MSFSFVNFTKKEYERRFNLIVKEMQKKNLDAFVTMLPQNLYYLAGYDSFGYYQYQCAIISKDNRVVLIIRDIELPQAEAQSCGLHEIIPYSQEHHDPHEITINTLREMAGNKGRIGVEKKSFFFQVATHDIIKDAMPECQLVDETDLISEIRLIKSEEELVYVRKAGEFSDIGHKALRENLRVGMLETELHGRIIGAMHEAGADWLTWPILMNCEGMMVHKRPVEKPLARGLLLNTEITGCYNRYNVNSSRAFSIGKSTAKMTEVHSIVLTAIEAAIKAVKPEVRIYDIDLAARKVITDAGYEKEHLHRTSYGLGIGLVFPAEPLSSQPNDPHVLKPGMVITVEPGIYLDDFAIRLGDCVIVTEDGAEIVHNVTRDLIFVD